MTVLQTLFQIDELTCTLRTALLHNPAPTPEYLWATVKTLELLVESIKGKLVLADLSTN